MEGFWGGSKVKKKKGGGGIWLRGPTLRCLGADGVPLPLSLFWWRPLGIGEAFKHSFRGQRQISELCSSPPSGLRQRLACSWQVCACMCIHYSNSSGEGSGCVSIAIGPIPGERSAHTLASRPPPRCCVVIINSDADFDKFFFFFFSFLSSFLSFFLLPSSPHHHCQQISAHSCAADSVFMEHSICCDTEGGSEGWWQGTMLGLPISLFPSFRALCAL